MIQQKQAIADCMDRLYSQGLTTMSGGNISIRMADDLVLVTLSATDKGHMRAVETGVVGLDGTNHTRVLKPSGETLMHLEIYKRRPDVHAIIHAHPPMASVFTVVDRPLNVRLIAESYTIIGDPAVVPYALTGTQELANCVAAALGGKTSCVLMQNHGVLTVGDTLPQAFGRIEVLENVAKINLFAGLLGGMRELSAEQCAALDRSVGHRG